MTLLHDIESFIANTGKSVSAFEQGARCHGLLSRLKLGADPRSATEERVRQFMEAETASQRAKHLSSP